MIMELSEEVSEEFTIPHPVYLHRKLLLSLAFKRLRRVHNCELKRDGVSFLTYDDMEQAKQKLHEILLNLPAEYAAALGD
jgi:hypothetical protein